jgi:hypothetical protein
LEAFRASKGKVTSSKKKEELTIRKRDMKAILKEDAKRP